MTPPLPETHAPLPGDEARWCSHCHQMLPHRFQPLPEAGPFWRCSECGEAAERNHSCGRPYVPSDASFCWYCR